MSLPTIVTPTTTNKTLIGYGVRVVTEGNFYATLTLHRILKEVDPAWPYQIDPDHKKKVTLLPAVKYTAKHLHIDQVMPQNEINLDMYLFYEPSQVGLITATYVKEVAEWIEKTLVGRDEVFDVNIEFCEITEQNKTTWFHGYGDDLFTLRGNESLAEEVELATQHFAVPSCLDEDEAADYEVYLLTGVEPNDDDDPIDPVDPTQINPALLEAVA